MPAKPSPLLDHVVINVQRRMDLAQQQFARSGFQLTERGHHTLGSINHLVMLGTDYLELIGMPEVAVPGMPVRADIADAPPGLNGLVFKSDDIEATHAHLQALGFAGDPPKSFSRPVELDGGQVDARFRTVHVRPGVFPAGRVYFCQHLTPELVWRPEWQVHPCGATQVAELVMVAQRPDEQAGALGRLLGLVSEGPGGDEAQGRYVTTGGTRLSVLSVAGYRRRYGDRALPGPRADAWFGALELRVDSLDPARAVHRAMPVPTPAIEGDRRFGWEVTPFATLLIFVA